MSSDQGISKALIAQLIAVKRNDDNVTRPLRLPRKDLDRFVKYIEVLQGRVMWPDQILLRLGDKLYVARNAQNQRVVKCECGQEFGDYRQNWKLTCRIRRRRTRAETREAYDPLLPCPEPGWQEIREFLCPACATEHAVEVVAPANPIVFESLPDLEKFYREYLGTPLPDEAPIEYRDETEALTNAWSQRLH